MKGKGGGGIYVTTGPAVKRQAKNIAASLFSPYYTFNDWFQ